MVEFSGIRDCGATFCTTRVLYGCAKTPRDLKKPAISSFSVPQKSAKVELSLDATLHGTRIAI